MQQAVIVDAVRTPVGRGRAGGALAGVHASELLAVVLRALVERSGIDPGLVDDVIIGCVSQVGEQASTPGRMAWLASGYPEHVPATTIDRKCGSGQQAVHFAAQGVMAGAYDVVIAGGVESMSRVVMGSARMGADSFGPGVMGRYAPGLVGQGVAAELVAARYGVSREAMDRYAAESHRRAAEAASGGAFGAEIVPVAVGNGLVEADETIRGGTTVERLAALRPAFADGEVAARFPEIVWSVTAGNASQVSDGASALLIMSEAAAGRLGVRARARFAGFDVVGGDPLLMLTAPIESTRRVLRKAGLGLGDVGHFEVNEAFACVPLAWQREMGVEDARLNPCGGAVALGHPLGASGARLMTTMLHAMERGGTRFGLQTMCEAGGMANSTVLELA